MSNLIPGNQKHLTLNDRLYIEHALDEGRSFRDIAKYLCKDPTTISREVRLHRSLDTWHKGSFNNPYVEGRNNPSTDDRSASFSNLK